MAPDATPRLALPAVRRARRTGTRTPVHTPAARVRVDGKFFARGADRLRLNGVTYGPFAPDAGSVQFPDAGRVHDDFRLMRECGVTAVRTYHVPPDSLLRQADQAGLSVLIDVPW